jgi:hypothetical protein
MRPARKVKPHTTPTRVVVCPDPNGVTVKRFYGIDHKRILKQRPASQAVYELIDTLATWPVPLDFDPAVVKAAIAKSRKARRPWWAKLLGRG